MARPGNNFRQPPSFMPFASFRGTVPKKIESDSSAVIDQANRPAVARREVAGLVSRCPDIEQLVKGNAEAGMAGVERDGRLRVSGGDVVQDENVAGGILVAGSRFPRDGRL